VQPAVNLKSSFLFCLRSQQTVDGTATYRYEVGKTRAKKSFNVSSQLLTNIRFPIRYFSNPCPNAANVSCWSEFVFVTAADRQHFHWAMDAVALIQHYFHDHTVFYYDLDNNTTDDSSNVKVNNADWLQKKFAHIFYQLSQS
jgi:hypothetical protein